MHQIVHQQVVSVFHHFVKKNPSGDGFKTIVTVSKKSRKEVDGKGVAHHNLCVIIVEVLLPMRALISF